MSHQPLKSRPAIDDEGELAIPEPDVSSTVLEKPKNKNQNQRKYGISLAIGIGAGCCTGC